MDDFLSEFLSNEQNDICKLKSIRKTNRTIVSCEKLLKQNLNKNQKKLLLKIIDENGLLIEKAHTESFIAGFKLGIKIGYEVNRDYQVL